MAHGQYRAACNSTTKGEATQAKVCVFVQDGSDGLYAANRLYLPVHRLRNMCPARLQLAWQAAWVLNLAKALAVRRAW